ncbi:MAG: T9SS type A sorting domain-containing protein, partial [Sphingobacteriaceae bacterium]
VEQLPGGPNVPGDVTVSSFSSWGPTDDGRVKPDIMGMGDVVYSTSTGSTSSYNYLSGTSMATPNVTGSLLLLQEYYAQKHNDSVMRSATLKGLACHTAFDAGNVGPDYKYGWGLLDMRKAANAIGSDGTNGNIMQLSLQQGQSQIYTVVSKGGEPLTTTVAWTDPEGVTPPYGTVNDRTPKLVNDLDVRISDEATVYNPWVLSPENPAAPATTGDNIRDNIEQVRINNTTAGKTYTITISHKGLLKNGGQDYSLIVSGGSINGSSSASTEKVLSAFPTPANDLLTVLFKVKKAGVLKMSLVNMSGRMVYSTERNAPAGNFNTQLDVTNIPTGVYALRIVSASKVYSQKVFIVK